MIRVPSYQLLSFAAIGIVFGLLASEKPVVAKLSFSPLASIVRDSDVIVVASANKIELHPDFTGEAVMEVRQVLKGEATSPLTLHWSAEEHDSRVTEVDEPYLLFLKTSSDGLRQSAYGRSFNPIQNDANMQPFVELSFPGYYLDPPKEMLKEIRVEKMLIVHGHFATVKYKTKGYYIDDLKRLIENPQ